MLREKKEPANNKVPKLHSAQVIQLNRGGVPSAMPQDQCRSWENTPDSLTFEPCHELLIRDSKTHNYSSSTCRFAGLGNGLMIILKAG